MYARTIVVLKLEVVEVLVHGLLLLGGPGGGGLGLLGVGGLGLDLDLADDDGHGGLPGLAVRELEQAEVEAGHGGRSRRRDLDRRLRVARLAAALLLDPQTLAAVTEAKRRRRRALDGCCSRWTRDREALVWLGLVADGGGGHGVPRRAVL